MSIQNEWISKCAHQHLGLWAVEPDIMTGLVDAFNSGHLASNSRSGKSENVEDFFVVRDGIAFGSITGAITKYESKFGGTSSLRVRSEFRAAEKDPKIKGAFIISDTPGGTVSGTHDATSAMASFSKKKPLHLHVSDLTASAGLWMGSQATRITANQKNALIGSIGVFTEILDKSEGDKQVGIKRHVLSTGPLKAAVDRDGKITDQALEDIESKMYAVLDQFVTSVAKGRNIDKAKVMELATGPQGGKTFLASEALKLGLIDSIESQESAVRNLTSEIKKADSRNEMEAKSRRNKINQLKRY